MTIPEAGNLAARVCKVRVVLVGETQSLCVMRE